MSQNLLSLIANQIKLGDRVVVYNILGFLLNTMQLAPHRHYKHNAGVKPKPMVFLYSRDIIAIPVVGCSQTVGTWIIKPRN